MLYKNLHILFLCGWYPSKISPYNGDFIERHAKAVAIKHKVSVIHIISNEDLKEEIEFTFKEKDNVETHIAYVGRKKNKLIKFHAFLNAYKKIRKKIGEIDVIHLNEIFPFGIFSLYEKWFNNKPFIISEHWTGYHFPNSKNIKKSQLFLSRLISKNAAYICPVSKNLKQSLTNLNIKGNYSIVPNVVDTSLFYPIENKNSIFNIIHVSNMNNNHKNITGILDVFKKILEKEENVSLTLIGENAKEYQSYCDKLKINTKNIELINQIPHKDIVKYLRKADIFILFSNYENLPCVILEAFSCGTPVISTNVGGINEFFPDNFGKLILKQDKEELEKMILDVIHKKITFANKKEMYNYVQRNFSEKTINSKFSNLYLNALDKV